MLCKLELGSNNCGAGSRAPELARGPEKAPVS